VSALDLRYNAKTDRLRATLLPRSEGEAVRVQQGKVTLFIDRASKQVVSFEVADFIYLANFHLLDQLFGDEVIVEIAAFQSLVFSTSRRSRRFQLPAPPRSSRRVVAELLRAA
jgi:hypothetical protein